MGGGKLGWPLEQTKNHIRNSDSWLELEKFANKFHKIACGEAFDLRLRKGTSADARGKGEDHGLPVE